jgi:hypothetical protein
MEHDPASIPGWWTWKPPTPTASPRIITKINRKEKYRMPKTTTSKSPSSADANSPFEMRARIKNYIRAGYPGLYLVSPEEQRVNGEMKALADELNYNLHFWSVVDGLIDAQTGQTRQANDPLEALTLIPQLKKKSIVLLRDFHLFLADPNPILIRQFKDVLQTAKTQNKILIILGCRLCLRVLIIIHGYGSSGQGGALNVGLRKSFGLRKEEGIIKEAIPGEDFSIFNDKVLALEVVPELRGDPDLGATNEGVTILWLK